MTAIYTTDAGKRRLHRRLEDARDHYDAIVATNPEAAESGDNCVWHDNFAYEENQRQMHAAARTVAELQGLLRRVVVVPVPERPERATIGTLVDLLFDDEDEPQTWVIGGFEDGDVREGRVSYTAPLARAVLGAQQGDLRTVVQRGRERRFEVTRVRRAPSEWDAPPGSEVRR